MSDNKQFDAIVIGAGFSGIYALKKLRDDCGLSTLVLEKGADVGGTWFYNKYPGCMSDVETFAYCYSWDKELLQDTPIKTRYAFQPDIFAYLQDVAKRHDLYKDIVFNTSVVSAELKENDNSWVVQTKDGTVYQAKYLVTALGVLSATNIPDFEGLDTFKGEWHHSSNWPDEVDFEGKRVGIIGTGSTGVQLTTAIAPQVKHLTVFQRTPQFTVPAGNRPLTAEEEAEIKANYQQIWEDNKKTFLAAGFAESMTPAMSVSAEEREAAFEKAWDHGGGFRFMFGTFGDIAVDTAANEEAAAFLRKKIASIVKDPKTADMLTPKGLYAKRPICDSGYYETFNRPNVSLVDVNAAPIQKITPNGILTEDGVEYPLDMILFATGFEAGDGNFRHLDIRGRNNLPLSEKWKDGSGSYLGLATEGFPNMFMVLGPNCPFTNIPPAVEVQVDWMADLITHARENGTATIEAQQEMEDAWGEVCAGIGESLLLSKIDSWIFGSNVAGKSARSLFYLGGIATYLDKIDQVKRDGYEGFSLAE